jgi:hypothetical protein
MKINIRDRNFSDFNKEIFYGEVGAILGAALISSAASHFTLSRVIIAQFAVVGSIVGGGSLFLLKKIKNKIRRREPIFRSIINDLEYFTPAAAVIGLLIVYPTLYYMAKFLVKSGWHTYLAGATAEICAFVIFLFLINLYRFGLIKMFRKNLA